MDPHIDVDAGIAAWETRSFDGVWSNSGVAVPGRPSKLRSLSWRELYEREREAHRAAQERAALVDDIDRCEHGRHRGDGCAGCGGLSLGNPLLRDGAVTLAYTISGARYVASPDRRVEVRQ